MSSNIGVPNGFVEEWQDAWNSHDLTRILSHYSEDIVFRSRKAEAIVGSGQLIGKPALSAYWQAALKRQPDLKFTAQDVFFGYQMLVITYKNHVGVKAAETLLFDKSGVVVQASACHADT